MDRRLSVYTFSLTTDWFHTVNDVAATSAPASAATRRGQTGTHRDPTAPRGRMATLSALAATLNVLARRRRVLKLTPHRVRK